MKKILLITIASIFLFATYLNAQTMYSDDFESYTVGNGIAQEEGNWWNTWSGAPGSAEDPTVSDAFAYQGTKSVKISGTNDGVIELNDLTSNRYRIEFYIMVPAGKQGYYNIMQNFNPSGAGLKWGIQVFVKDGTLTIDGAGLAAATYTYTPGEWMKVQHFVDLDNDWIDMYINDNLVHAYQWSKGTFDDGTGINKLDALDFYANAEGGTPEFYLDNFLIEQVATLTPPQNLTYNIVNDNDVELSWEAPTSGTIENYSIVRDGIEIATTNSTTLTYTDTDLYPNDYQYEVKAYCGSGSGYSPSSNVLNINIPGGNDRELVIFEILTSTNCGYCPTAAQAIDMLVEEGKQVGVIEYHGNGMGAEPYVIPETENIGNYYLGLYPTDNGQIGYPASIFNGTQMMVGAAPTVADQNEVYDYYYDEQIAIPSVFTIELSKETVSTNPYEFNIDVNVEETFDYFNDELRLKFILTETDISYSWQGQSELHFVARDMYPDANGTVLDFSSESTINTQFNVSIAPSWNVDNCEVIAYVQNNDTGHILQAQKMSLSTLSNSEIAQEFKLAVYPNPAKSVLNITASENINKIEVLNIAGQLVVTNSVGTDNTSLNVEEYPKGVYFIKVYTNNNVKIKRFVIE